MTGAPTDSNVSGAPMVWVKADDYTRLWETIARLTEERDWHSNHHAHYHQACSAGGNEPCSHEQERDQARREREQIEREAVRAMSCEKGHGPLGWHEWLKAGGGQCSVCLTAEVQRQAEQIAELRGVVEQVDYFGEALIQREYDSGSATVRQLVASATAALARPNAAPAEGGLSCPDCGLTMERSKLRDRPYDWWCDHCARHQPAPAEATHG